MTSEDLAPARQTWPVLTVNERRVLGVLIEKAKTTPDIYPLSLNSLVTGSNQKSNRDPFLTLTDADVEEAITSLKPKGMVQQITGSGRVDKFRHVMYESLKVDKVQLAVLGELLLRGPQTEGELRGRASRMEPIEDLDALRPVLHGLAERGLVVYLTPEGRRGTSLTHGFHDAAELARLKASAEGFESNRTDPAIQRSGPAEPGLLQRVQSLEQAIAEMRQELMEMRAKLSGSTGEL